MRLVATLMAGVGAAGLGLVGVNYAGLGGQDDSVRADDGAIVEGGEVGAFRLQLGDCFLDVDDAFFESVEAVPCSEPHISEVYAAFVLPDGDFPGLGPVGDVADDRCLDELGGSVDLSLDLDDFGYTSITPTQESWDEIGDREVLCIIGRIDRAPTAGSVRLADDAGAVAGGAVRT